MKKFTIVLYVVFLISQTAIAQFVCTPCNLDCDTIEFKEAGTCPHCQMPLVSKSSLQTSNELLTTMQEESDSNSQVMRTVSFLSDVYGPRMMGTPNYYQAARWAVQELQQWGIMNTKLDPFDDGHRGWETTGFKVEMTAPSYSQLHTMPLAFTEGTVGDQTGQVMFIKQFEEVYALKDSLKGKILLLKGYYRPVQSVDYPLSQRLSDETLTKAAANPDPNELLIGYHSRRSITDVFERREATKEERSKFFDYCKKQGVIAIIEPSDFPYGMLHADGNRAVPSFCKSDDIRPIASFVMANEDFGRLLRLSELGFKPALKVNLQVKTYQEPKYNVNVIAEIPGTDPLLKEEVIIIGAHLDSWHAGTGAVDNASNCAVMMEAMRLIKVANFTPKRTIRLILWGGEEQVFAGSLAYVEKNIGTFGTTNLKVTEQQISAYLNLDNGAGKIRGIYLMGNEKVTPYFSEYLWPFEESRTLTLQNANQTDHELFDYHNVPAFQFIQDPLDYITAIHHTNMDRYEYVPKADQQYNAVLLAYLTCQIAQADALLPRKPFNAPLPSKHGKVTFQLSGYQNADQVSLVGDFNNWDMFGTRLYKTATGWETKIDLPKGRYYYKYIIDGQWTADPATPQHKLVKDGKGHGGLTVLKIAE